MGGENVTPPDHHIGRGKGGYAYDGTGIGAFLIGIIQLSMELWRGIIRLARAGRPERTHLCRPGWREGVGFCSPAGFGPRDRRLAWGRTMGAKSCYLGRRVGGTDALWLD